MPVTIHWNYAHSFSIQRTTTRAKGVSHVPTFLRTTYGARGSNLDDESAVFYGPSQIGLETVPIPKPRAGEAVIRVTLTTICGAGLHILRGEYPVKPGLIIGHELVGIIHELGEGITDTKLETACWWAQSHHTMLAMQLLFGWKLVAVWRTTRRMEVRQHHQRRSG